MPARLDPAEWFVENKFGVIVTLGQKIAPIERLYEQQGNFGVFLQQVRARANFEKTKRSYALYQCYLMPHFFGANRPRSESFDGRSAHRDELTEKRTGAARTMFENHEAEQQATMTIKPRKDREAW